MAGGGGPLPVDICLRFKLLVLYEVEQDIWLVGSCR